MTKKFEEFPYPFKEDVYRYSNNSVPLNGMNCLDVTSKYQEEIMLKRELLSHYPSRCYHSQPYTMDGQWEVLQLVLDHLTENYPDQFSIERHGEMWLFTNNYLNETHSFRFGDEGTLPFEPLDFIGRHVQEDLILMMQRDGDLYLEAGQLCFPSNWSLAFNAGMNFKDIHFPIPGFNHGQLDDRILNFLLRLEAGNPWWRKNWSLMAGDRLDTSLETFDVWGKEREKVTKENAGKLVHFRVEVQKLFRLPKSNAILFTIHTHLILLEEFVQKREWLEQFHSILEELPSYIADYKGISIYKKAVLDYLKCQLQEEG